MLIELLGLAASATDDEIMNARGAFGTTAAKNMADLSNCKVLAKNHAELTSKYDTLLNSVVASDLEEFKGVIGEDREQQEHWRGQLVANRDAARKTLGALANRITGSRANTPMHNRQKAGTPGAVTGDSVDPAVAHAKMVNARAQMLLRNGTAKTFDVAFSLAQRELK